MQTKYSLLQAFRAYAAPTAVLAWSLTLLVVLPVEANPQADVHLKKGLQLSLQKRWAEAETQYRKAIALDPKNASYKSYLADALAAQGKYEAAKDSYQQSANAKQTYPNNNAVKPVPTTPAQARTANAKKRVPTAPPSTQVPQSPGSGEEKRKEGDQETVTFVTPDGRTVTVTSKAGQAVPIPQDGAGDITIDMDKGVTDAAYKDPNYVKGQHYAEAEKWPQAVSAFRAAAKNHPRSTACWDALGDARFKQGQWKEAESAHRTASRLEPEEGYFCAQVAGDLLKQGRREEAKQSALQALRLGLEDHWVFDELGLHVNRSG